MSLGEKLRRTLLGCGQIISAEHNVNIGIIGKRCADNRKFFTRLAEGDNFTIETADEALAWLSHFFPKSKKWPDAWIERPKPKFVREVMERLPEDRRVILIPRRGRDGKKKHRLNEFMESPSVSDVAVATLAPTRSKPIPPGNDRVGDFVED